MRSVRTAIVAAASVVGLLGSGQAAALGLPEFLAQVQAQNPMLTAQRAMASAAERRIPQAGAWSPPMLEFGALNVPSNGKFNMDPMTMTMVGLTQRVPLFGSKGLSKSAAREGYGAAVASSEFSRYEALGMAWESYSDAYYSAELAKAASGHRDMMNQLVESAQARVRSGSGRLDDALRAEAERARVLTNLNDFNSERHAAWARVQALRGASPLEEPDTLSPPVVAPVQESAATWQSALPPDHPRLRQLDATVQQYRFQARAARRMVWPDVELRGSYAFRRTLEDGTVQDNMFNATVAVMLPIFAGSRELAEGAEMDAMARAAEAERRSAELQLQQDIGSAHAEALASQRNVRLLADTVIVVQRQALQASWSAYRTGSSDLWRVFEASHELYNEEVSLVRARQTLARAEARLISLTGRVDLFGVALPPVKE